MGYQDEDCLFCIIPNAPGRYDKMCEVRKQITIGNKNQMVFSYNSLEDYSPKSRIHIRILVPKGDGKTAAKLFMKLVNGCEDIFRIKTNTEDNTPMKWSNLFKKPYPDYSNINTIDELINFPTPDHYIKFYWSEHDIC